MDQSTALTQAKTGGLMALTALNNPFAKAAKNEGVTDGFWLRMNGKTGAWLTNLPNTTELEPGTELVFNIWNAEQLWQGFDKQNKLYNGPKVSILSGAPLADPPPTPGVQWKKHIRVMVASTADGKQMSLTCKADNPYREIWKLVKRYGELLVRFPDAGSKTGYMCPIVTIGSTSYDMMAKEKKVVKNATTGVEEIVEVEQKITNYREVFKITDNEDDWISEVEMQKILLAAVGVEAGDVAVAAQVSAPSANAADFVDTTPQPEVPAAPKVAAAEAEIIPPAQTASSFRRNRAGQAGVRTA